MQDCPLEMIKEVKRSNKEKQESRHTYAVAALSTGWSAKTEKRIQNHAPPTYAHKQSLVFVKPAAFTKELRTLVAFLTRRFVCVCAGGKISRLAGIHVGDIPCVIACVE